MQSIRKDYKGGLKMADFEEIYGVLIDTDEILYVGEVANYFPESVGFDIHFKNGEEKHIKGKDRKTMIEEWEFLKFVMLEKGGKC